MILDPVDLLAELVKTPSVNPMGREALGPPYLEGRLTDYLEGLLQRLGLAVERQSVLPGRENLLAVLPGEAANADGPVILLDAHQDTVPVDGMTVEPFGAEIRDGRLYGRGACDVKGGMAAILAAVSRLAAERPRTLPTILLSFTVNEEYGFDGAATLAGRWGTLRRAPDVAIVAEPTGLEVVVAHKGVIRWQCHALGRAAHSSRPTAGENAIYKMARVIAAIERYTRDVLGRMPAHPLCGPATLNVGTIRGGVSVNTVPDGCTIEMERRLAPGEDPLAARQHLIAAVGAAVVRDVEAAVALPPPSGTVRDGSATATPTASATPAWLVHDEPYMQGPPMPEKANGPLADRLESVVRAVLGHCRRIGVPYATNAAFYFSAGVPAVVFGPGSLDQAHTSDEWIALDQLRQASEVFYQFCRNYALPTTH